MKLFLLLIIVLFQSCSSLRPIKAVNSQKLDKYKFAVIPSTSSLSSYNNHQMKSINPSSLIEGILLKKGITALDKVDNRYKNKTLLVRYGQSGKRSVGIFGAYTLEVTIKILDASSLKDVYFCTAEGMGSTEADDIRQAIERCLSNI